MLLQPIYVRFHHLNNQSNFAVDSSMTWDSCERPCICNRMPHLLDNRYRIPVQAQSSDDRGDEAYGGCDFRKSNHGGAP